MSKAYIHPFMKIVNAMEPSETIEAQNIDIQIEGSKFNISVDRGGRLQVRAITSLSHELVIRPTGSNSAIIASERTGGKNV